jgi:putative ABC transport system substrate-binding protein
LAALAAELVRLQVDIIYAETTLAALAAKQATTTIPIVFNPLADPVGSGLVASLARPGGNVTGMSFMGVDLVAKRLQLLKEAVPRASRMAVLWQPGAFGEGTVREMFEEAEAAARALGVQLRFQEARGPNDFNGVFSAMTKARAGALMLLPSPIFASERRRVVDLAAKGRLPTMYYGREYAEVGGLMAYGPNYADLCRRTATYVDKILKGAKPADLPVEQPMRFEFAINMKTAKALGLTFPPTILIRADQVIQ